MAKSTKGAKGLGKALQGKPPQGGSSSKGRGKQQDIELGGETKPAAGARSSGRQSSIVTPEEIGSVLNQSGKPKKGVTDDDVKQVVFKWLKNESQSLEDLGKANGGKVLKWLQSQSDELYVDGLAKIKDPNNTAAITRQTQNAWKEKIGEQKPNESRPKVNGKTVTFRPEGRPNRQIETTGNIDPNPTSVERLEKVGQRMDADAASDDDYLYALGQGSGPNNIDAELARIQTITDTNERQKAILALAQNTTQAMGRGDNATTIKVGQWLDQYLNKTAQPTTPKGGGVTIGDGPLPGERQQPLNFDGGGDTAKEGPEIVLDTDPKRKDVDPEPELPNQAAAGDNTTRADNANQTANTTEGPGPQTAEPKGDFGAENEMPELEAWARSHLINAYINKHGVDPTQDAKHAKRFQQGWDKFMQQVGQQPDPLETLRQFKQNNVNAPQGSGSAGPRQPQPNRQTPNQAASSGNKTRNTTKPVQPGTTPQPGKSVNPPMAATGIAPPPGYKGPTPGKGGSVSGLKTGGKSEPPQKGMSPDEWKARAAAKEKEFNALDAKINKDRRLGAASVAAAGVAAGVAGSLAWKWLAGGDDEPEVQLSAPTASITGGPSTSTGSASGSVADGSGGSSGGMSQEQMEYMMKLQQIRDEQKRRHVGFGNTHSGVSR